MTSKRQRAAKERETVTLELPYPPTVNTYWRRAKDGRVFVAAAGRRYKRLVWLLTARSRRRLSGAIRVSVSLHPPAKRRKRDLDNVLKDRKSTRLNSSHSQQSRMPSSA